MLRRVCLRALALAWLCGGAAALSAQPLRDPTLSVPEAYFPGLQKLLDAAVQQAPRMLARNTQEYVAEQERVMARSAQLPSMRAYVSYYPWTQDRRGDIDETSRTQKSAYNLFLEQAVFHWGALKNTSRIGELRQKIAAGETVEAFRLLVSEIRGQYLQLVMKRLALSRARVAQRMAEEALKEAEERLARQQTSENDMFGPRITTDQARLWTDRMQEDYDTARLQLGRLCGLPPIPDAEVPESIPEVKPTPEALEQAVGQFLASGEPKTYGLQNLQAQIDIERLNYKITDARLRPKVNAVVGLTQDEQTYVYSFDRERNYKYEVQSLYTGVRVDWSIFDGFHTRAAKAASLARRRQMERQFGEQVESIVLNVRAKQRQAEFAARSLAISEKYLAQTRRDVLTKEENHQRGQISTQDLAAARLQLFDIEVTVYNARNDYLLRVADLLSAAMRDPALARLPNSLQ